MPEDRSGLKQQWRTWAEGLQVKPAVAEDVLTELFQLYQQPYRKYHNLDHISHLLELLARHQDQVQDQALCFFATWFHDAIYRPLSRKNEERSAELAADLMARMGLDSSLIQKVTALILCTRDHKAVNPDQVFFLDMDLAILGSEPQKYQGYAIGVAQESGLPKRTWRVLRNRWLRKMQTRPILFQNQLARQLFETQARENMAAELVHGKEWLSRK